MQITNVIYDFSTSKAPSLRLEDSTLKTPWLLSVTQYEPITICFIETL